MASNASCIPSSCRIFFHRVRASRLEFSMGLDTNLTGQAGKNSRWARPLQRYSSNVDERDAEERPRSRASLLNTLDNEFGEPNASPSRKSMPCRFNAVNLENHGVLKRGSVYQSSKEVRKLMRQREVLREPELEASDESFLSFEVVKRSSGHCRSAQKKRDIPQNLSSVGDSTLDLSFRLLPEVQPKWSSQRSDVCLATQSSSDKFLEIGLPPQIPKVYENLENFPLNRSKFGSNGDASCSEKLSGAAHILPKSYSAKIATCNPEIDLSSTSQKSPFPPVRKMWDPMKKSKSQRNPSLSNTSSCNEDPPSQKPPLNCLSLPTDHRKKTESHGQLCATAESAAHLRATLKLETSQSSSPSFEFSLRDAEESLSCKTWKAQNALNWAYTFHSRRKNSGNSWNSKDRHRQTLPIVGQMHASCYLSSQLSSNGLVDNFAVAEFVLQDISHLKSSPSPDLLPRKEDVARVQFQDPNLLSESETRKNPSRVAAAESRSPELHPELEIAAIVVQIPYDGTRSLREKLRAEACEEEQRPGDPIRPRHISVKVVTSSGRHGLSCTEETGPSHLLDRWRSHGACDCGGWDMACPITILDNNSADQSLTRISRNHLSLKLLVQGAKDKTPALSITSVGEDGQYSVNFHGQFTKLQAFSICVAVVHSLEAFGLLNQERNGQKLHSRSLELVLEEEVRHLLDAVAKGEQRKVSHKPPNPYFLDPPFSPIGRV